MCQDCGDDQRRPPAFAEKLRWSAASSAVASRESGIPTKRRMARIRSESNDVVLEGLLERFAISLKGVSTGSCQFQERLWHFAAKRLHYVYVALFLKPRNVARKRALIH